MVSDWILQIVLQKLISLLKIFAKWNNKLRIHGLHSSYHFSESPKQKLEKILLGYYSWYFHIVSECSELFQNIQSCLKWIFSQFFWVLMNEQCKIWRFWWWNKISFCQFLQNSPTTFTYRRFYTHQWKCSEIYHF